MPLLPPSPYRATADWPQRLRLRFFSVAVGSAVAAAVVGDGHAFIGGIDDAGEGLHPHLHAANLNGGVVPVVALIRIGQRVGEDHLHIDALDALDLIGKNEPGRPIAEPTHSVAAGRSVGRTR